MKELLIRLLNEKCVFVPDADVIRFVNYARGKVLINGGAIVLNEQQDGQFFYIN